MEQLHSYRVPGHESLCQTDQQSFRALGQRVSAWPADRRGQVSATVIVR
jgi:hypothetical protein